MPNASEGEGGFAIGVYGEDVVEANAEDQFGRDGDEEDRRRAVRAGFIRYESGRGGVEITRKGWDRLNDDIRMLEQNSLDWLRKTFRDARDEGHGGIGDELIGTFWFDPSNVRQAELIETGLNERIDMTDTAFGDLAKTVWRGVSPFGQAVLGGQINFFDVHESAIEDALERSRRSAAAVGGRWA